MFHYTLQSAERNKGNSKRLPPFTRNNCHAVHSPFNWYNSIAKLTYKASAERNGEGRGWAGGHGGVQAREFILLSSLEIDWFPQESIIILQIQSSSAFI